MRILEVTLFGTLAAVVCTPAHSWAEEFHMQEVPSLPLPAAGALAPHTILFTDHRRDELVDPTTGLIHFSDWEHSRLQQKQLLSLFPSFEEPMVTSAESAAKLRKRRLHVYVADARFALAKPAASIHLSKMITLAMIEQLDPSIKHRLISAADVIPNKDPKSSNHNPKRQWCEGGATLICVQSRYQLEGRLPIGIMLVNKIRENHKKIADFVEFQSELRLVPQEEIDQAALAKATGIGAPVAGVVEQNIFYVNQIMQFGKFLAVLQPDPADAEKSVATAFIALAVDSELFEKKKELESVPILRNLVPAQVLAGNSSFNSGNSISAGLPKYSRNRVKAVAAVADLRWRLRELHRHKIPTPIHFDHREVAHSIGTNHPRFVDVALVSANLNRRASLDDMIACDCVAIGGNEETGSLRCTKP
jgi:hypothetical protein